MLQELARSGNLACLSPLELMAGHLHLPTMQVPGAEVRVYRVKDPVRGDDPQYFEDGVLDAEPITEQVCIVDFCRTLLICTAIVPLSHAV